MKTIINNSIDPFFNLALEEYLLKEYDLNEDIFYVWRNSPSIVIGRNQNPYNEVDMKYCFENNIPIIRRISGGGTVYNDLGNVNFTYISSNIKNLNNYQIFLEPIIALLNQMGLCVNFEPKSHLFLSGNKISGNAQAYHKNRMLHHGTLLFDADITCANKALKRKNIDGHHVLSTPANICNIYDKTPVSSTVDEFMEYILQGILKETPVSKIKELDSKELLKIEKLKEEKYKTFKWNFGTNASFQIKNKLINLDIENGIIVKSSIKSLEGHKLKYEILKNSLEEFENKEELLSIIF